MGAEFALDAIKKCLYLWACNWNQ